MMQPDATPSQDAQIVLKDVLHIIANHRKPEDCVLPILQAAQTVVKAAGACLYLFRGPELLVTQGISDGLIPQDDSFNDKIRALKTGIHINPELPGNFAAEYPGWLVAPIIVDKNVAGTLLLLFQTPLDLSEDDRNALTALVDSLAIVGALAHYRNLTRTQSEFMRIATHDLRSPLTSTQGFASMLESSMVGDLNEKQTYYVQKILSGTDQMTSLVDNIQDAGRYDPETGFYEMERTPCDVIEIIHSIVESHLVPAEKQELTLEAKSSDDVPIINADKNMLERALINLVDNAIKYTPNGGHITVSAVCKDDQVILSVSDDGYGISSENQRGLFERHVRIRRDEHKRVKGSGLGLFIVRSVAKRHGGRAWVESAEGKGSTFYFSIPLDEANLLVPGRKE